MRLITKPKIKPLRPEFSSGPCAKRPGWDIQKIVKSAYLGRSHRATGPKSQIQKVIRLTKETLEIPEHYRVAVVPASNTGAFEMAMWTMLGKCPVDILAWENFGLIWANDIIEELQLEDYHLISADYGLFPNLTTIREQSDICFTWNGTTSGVRVPDANWISSKREGLVLCDATSAVFSQKVDWAKLDVTSFSWQKAMGGEAAHGVLVLSPKAIERLENFTPDRPLPKIFRLVKNGKLINGIFTGETVNTPSMFCVSDALDALHWIKELGGQTATIERANANFKILQGWLDQQCWVENLVSEEDYRSNTSVCLKIVAEEFLRLAPDQQQQFVTQFVSLLELEGVAFDIGGHREAPPGLRIWCGPTIEEKDLHDLLPWLNWAFETVKVTFF